VSRWPLCFLPLDSTPDAFSEPLLDAVTYVLLHPAQHIILEVLLQIDIFLAFGFIHILMQPHGEVVIPIQCNPAGNYTAVKDDIFSLNKRYLLPLLNISHQVVQLTSQAPRMTPAM
jgi:hypothetical protein